jgi:hypothetical protein
VAIQIWQGKWPDAVGIRRPATEDGSGIRLFFSCSSVVRNVVPMGAI